MATFISLLKLSTSVYRTGVRRFSKVGFIGLGNMGEHMAKNILKKGYKLVVYDVNKAAISKLTESGAEAATSITDVSENVDVLVSMLPSNQHVLDCYMGEKGVLSSVKKTALLIDSSTVDPSIPQTIAKEAEKRGARFIDAPVSGGVIGARDGTLTFMVGGSKENVEIAEPLLENMGSRIVHCGDIGMGQAAKICNNMLLAISMVGTAEAYNLGQRLGLEANILNDIVNSSSGRCWSSELYNPVPGLLPNVPSSNKYEGGFGTALLTKDLGLAETAANRTETPIPLGSLVHQIYRTLTNSGFANKDFAVVYQFLRGTT